MRCSSCASRPACRRTPSRSASRQEGLLVASDVVAVVATLVFLAQEARQLCGEGVAGWEIGLLRELVDATLQLLHVRGRLLVARDGLAHLLRVGIGRLVQLVRVDIRA